MQTFFNLLALEGSATDTPTKSAETEIVVYSKIGNSQRLAEATDQEDHIQLETLFENGTPCRVRKVTKQGKDNYFFTYKLPSKLDNATGIDAKEEFTVEVDEVFFNGFMSVASRKLVKTRYVFNSTNVTLSMNEGSEERSIVIPNIKYEVDVYTKEDGSVCEWCKIDIEVDNILEYVDKNHKDISGIKLNVKVSHLPFEPSASILSSAATDEQRIQIDSIWKDFVQKLTTGNNIDET